MVVSGWFNGLIFFLKINIIIIIIILDFNLASLVIWSWLDYYCLIGRCFGFFFFVRTTVIWMKF